MTSNQSNQIVKNPNTKKAMAVLGKFAQLDVKYKALEKEAKEATELIKEAMIDADVPRIEVDMPGLTGYITLAERTNYRADDLGAVDDKYLKLALDTTKVGAEKTLTGNLPDGVVESKTQYITKKFKVVE